MRSAILLLLTMMAPAVWADVHVEVAAGKLVVRVDAERLAAWRISADQLAILAEGSGDVVVDELPRGWSSEGIGTDGMHGVVLKGGGGSWNVMHETGQWLIREGKPTQGVVSALLLKDGWRMGGKKLETHDVKLGETRWRVAGVESADSVAGSVVGVVKKLSGNDDLVAQKIEKEAETAPERIAASTAKAAVTGKGKNNMRVVSVSEMLSRLEPASGNVKKAVPSVMAAPTTAMESAGRSDGKVPVRLAEGLQPVATPHALSETLAVGDNVYRPGTIIHVSVPDDFKVSATTMIMPVNDASSQAMQPERKNLFKAKGSNYVSDLSDIMQMLVEVPAGSEAERLARRQLASFYLTWQRPEEAMGLLSMLPKRADGLPADATARLYLGLAQLLAGRPVSEGVFDQQGELAVDAQLWRAVAASKQESFAQALKEWPDNTGLLSAYTPELRELAIVQQATTLVMVGEPGGARKVVDKLAAKFAVGEVPSALLRLQGLVRMGSVDEDEGLQKLALASADTHDPLSAHRAKFEFVQALRQRHDLSDQQVIKYLEDLWLDWRGDNLEKDVLGELAALYEKAGQPREALEHWQALVRAYPDLPNINAITARMTNAFADVFDPENPVTYDPLTYLGLYYDFRELLPTDARGDQIQEQVAHLLADSTLWMRAAPVLEQQLQYRALDPIDQARLAMLLAEVYRRQGRPAEGLKLLDKWQKVAVTGTLARNWQMGQARCLMDLGRYDSAKRALGTLNDIEAEDLRAEADWNAKNWPSVVGALQAQLGGITSAVLVSDTAAQLKVFRLAYAYGQLKDGSGLKTVQDRYKDALTKLPDLADGVNAVAASTDIGTTTGGGTLAPLSTALASLNGFADDLKHLRRDRGEERRKRQEYNDKMRYMELLPPPVL